MDNESFFKMPKVLFTDEYKDLSAEAKLLYGLMLDRMQLSAINGWCDKNGEVFIFYTIAETSEMLGCGHDKATRLQRELEKHNLLRRKYQGKGKPAKLYTRDRFHLSNRSWQTGSCDQAIYRTASWHRQRCSKISRW